MNFILIISDTLRRDHLGCYGNDWISTPHIDLFAERSLLFLNAYSASFPTVPHRRDVLTGRYTAAYTPWAPLSADEIVLPDMLRPAGYASMMIADTPHILANGYHYDRGFDGWEWIRGQESDRWRTWPDAPGHPCDPDKLRNPDMLSARHRRNSAWWEYESDHCVARTMTRACRWLEKNHRRERFFLHVDTFDPHEPWDPPDWYVRMYDPDYDGEAVDYPLYAFTDFLSEGELRHARALYAAEVSLVDRWVGRLLEKIEDLGLLDDTLVCLTTDHGFLHGEHGIMGKLVMQDGAYLNVPLYEEICHIPMIVHFPGAGAGAVEALVQPMDYAPTLLALAGVGAQETINGKSFAGLLTRESETHREFAVSSPYLDGGVSAATVSDGRWSAVFWSQPKEGEEAGPADPRLAREGMLFDLAADPGQSRNVLGEHLDVFAHLRDRALAFWQELGTAPDVLARWRLRAE